MRRDTAQQVADLRERLQIDEWDTAAWEALVAAVADTAERSPSAELMEQQRLAYNEILARFPTAVSARCRLRELTSLHEARHDSSHASHPCP